MLKLIQVYLAAESVFVCGYLGQKLVTQVTGKIRIVHKITK